MDSYLLLWICPLLSNSETGQRSWWECSTLETNLLSLTKSCNFCIWSWNRRKLTSTSYEQLTGSERSSSPATSAECKLNKSTRWSTLSTSSSHVPSTSSTNGSASTKGTYTGKKVWLKRGEGHQQMELVQRHLHSATPRRKWNQEESQHHPLQNIPLHWVLRVRPSIEHALRLLASPGSCQHTFVARSPETSALFSKLVLY